MTRSFWQVAEADPERVALIDADGDEVSYGDLRAAVNRLTHGLCDAGLVRGDVLAVAVPNCPAFIECYLAAAQSGLYFVPINRHLAAAEVAYIVADSDAKVLVAHADLGDVAVVAAREAGLDVEHCLVVAGTLEGFRPYESLPHGQADTRPEDRPAGQVMMYSSGTTGRPKGVRRPLPDGDPDELASFTAMVTCKGFGIEPDGVHLVCGPLYHAGPFLGAVNTLHSGHTVVLTDHFDAETTLRLIERHRVTSTQMVPTMFHRLLALPEEVRSRYDVTSVRSVLHTGAACPVDVKSRMMQWWGPVLYETYGGTEAAATIAKPHRWLERPGTVGKPINGVTVKIFDDDGHECAPGVPGDIYIASSFGAGAEYYKDPQKSASIRKGEYVTLGDVGYLDEDGYLFLCDRKIDMIVSGGVNIYPAEVEAALLAHPAVRDAAVIGVPDEEWGEQVKAVVELVETVSPGPDLADELVAFCRERIARFKCPRTLDFRELPRLPNGKLLKRRLREEYLAAPGGPA